MLFHSELWIWNGRDSFFKKTSRVAATKKDFLERCRTCWIRRYYSPLAIDQALASKS